MYSLQDQGDKLLFDFIHMENNSIKGTASLHASYNKEERISLQPGQCMLELIKQHEVFNSFLTVNFFS